MEKPAECSTKTRVSSSKTAHETSESSKVPETEIVQKQVRATAERKETPESRAGGTGRPNRILCAVDAGLV